MLSLLTCFFDTMQVGFVNSLAFAKSGTFLVAGVGQVKLSFLVSDILFLFYAFGSFTYLWTIA